MPSGAVDGAAGGGRRHPAGAARNPIRTRFDEIHRQFILETCCGDHRDTRSKVHRPRSTSCCRQQLMLVCALHILLECILPTCRRNTLASASLRDATTKKAIWLLLWLLSRWQLPRDAKILAAASALYLCFCLSSYFVLIGEMADISKSITLIVVLKLERFVDVFFIDICKNILN